MLQLLEKLLFGSESISRIVLVLVFSNWIVNKGFIAINGASLTVVKNDSESTFSVHLIPETLRVTTLSDKNVGDQVNIEIDAQTKVIVETVKQVLADQNP